MPLTRAQRLKKRRLETSKPSAPPNGMFFFDQITGHGEVFITFDELKQAANEIMTYPDHIVEHEVGKMNYRRDPTYEMRRKRS